MATPYQGSSEIIIRTEPERIWAIPEDSTLLPQWAPMVRSTTGKTERVGSICQPLALNVRTLAKVTLLSALLLAGCTSLKRLAYEGFGRDRWQKPDQVIQAMGIQPGDQVADLGAGFGYFTFRLAKAVGSNGKVYAVDVDPAMLDHLKQKTRDEGYSNVAVIQAEYHDPKLPEAGVNLIFVCNVYHHIEKRADYFKHAQRYLRKGGSVAIVDFNGKGWLERLFIHTVPREVVLKEMEAAGYRLQQEHDFLPRQYFLVFSRSG